MKTADHPTKARRVKSEKTDISSELPDFSSELDDEAMNQLETAAQSQGIGRRLALVALSRDRATLAALCVDSPATFREMVEAIESFKAHAEGLSELADSAMARMLVAGAHAESAARGGHGL